MVCEKHAEVKHNFDVDPIVPKVLDGWVKASGTTLGADAGYYIRNRILSVEVSDGF